jgi:hypothetical protein
LQPGELLCLRIRSSRPWEKSAFWGLDSCYYIWSQGKEKLRRFNLMTLLNHFFAPGSLERGKMVTALVGRGAAHHSAV